MVAATGFLFPFLIGHMQFLKKNLTRSFVLLLPRPALVSPGATYVKDAAAAAAGYAPISVSWSLKHFCVPQEREKERKVFLLHQHVHQRRPEQSRPFF